MRTGVNALVQVWKRRQLGVRARTAVNACLLRVCTHAYRCECFRTIVDVNVSVCKSAYRSVHVRTGVYACVAVCTRYVPVCTRALPRISARTVMYASVQ